jgi:hypothetical protein
MLSSVVFRGIEVFMRGCLLGEVILVKGFPGFE